MPDSTVDSTAQDTLRFDAESDTRFQIREILPEAIDEELERVQFDESYRHAAAKKFHHRVIKAWDLSAPAANILKQSCLSIGAEAAVHRGAINCKIDREALLISVTDAQLERLIQKLRPQPFGLAKLAQSLIRLKQRQKSILDIPPRLMAILNVTPDSFSDGGKLSSLDDILAQAEQAISDGATILDIGGESTRPGAQAVDFDEEYRRVIPAVKALREAFPEITLSVDTRKARLAEAALEAGASMINDVSGLTFDPDMVRVIADASCPVVIMHSHGTPETMQDNPQYNDVMGEVTAFFYQQMTLAADHGVSLDNIILDPGFGFGKTTTHNLTLHHRLPELVSIGQPLLLGTSRKSMFMLDGAITKPPVERDSLSAASLALGLQAGAKIIRVHNTHELGPVFSWVCLMLDMN